MKKLETFMVILEAILALTKTYKKLRALRTKK